MTLKSIQELQSFIEHGLSRLSVHSREPMPLYEPISYALSGGGKRLRPTMLMAFADLFGAPMDQALPVALAYEVFHNFTLLHDDLMDNSLMRRGRPSIMNQFGANQAILSGDAMFTEAYTLLEQLPDEQLGEQLRLFNQMSRDVMEGQQWDMDFESMDQVYIFQYIRMIALKTGALIASASKAGALLGGATPYQADSVYRYAMLSGIAFQLQDDYLDLYGDVATFGKPIGGDVLEKKKTIFYVLALSQDDPTLRQHIKDIYNMPLDFADDKITMMQALMIESGVKDKVSDMIQLYQNKAIAQLVEIEQDFDLSVVKELEYKINKRNY